MKIIVHAKPRSKKVSVERVTQPTFEYGAEDMTDVLTVYKVSITEPPIDGKANKAIIKALADYFDVAPSLVRLVSGSSTKHKIFEILE